ADPIASSPDILYLCMPVAGNMDQSSALPFWLPSTSSVPRYPFTSTNKRSNAYVSFDERRLASIGTITGNSMVTPAIPDLPVYAYRPRHAGESYYIYIEARHYPLHTAGTLDASQAAAIPAGSGPPMPRTPDISVRPWTRPQV